MERTRKGVRWLFTALVVDFAVTAFSPGLALLLESVATGDLRMLPYLTSVALGVVIGGLYLVAFTSLYRGRAERGDDGVRRMQTALRLVGLAIALAASFFFLRAQVVPAGFLGAGFGVGVAVTTSLSVAAALAAGLAFRVVFQGMIADGFRLPILGAIGLGAVSALLPGIAFLLLDAAADPADVLAAYEVLIAAGWISGAASLAIFAVACNDAQSRLPSPTA
jgi:hypothetical protein